MITNVEETELTNGQLDAEQLDAVSGGGPSLWDILGPAITQTVNAGKQTYDEGIMVL